MQGTFKNITTNTTTLVKTGPGVLNSIVVNNPADITVAKLTLALYDSLVGSGTLIGTVTVPVSTSSVPFAIPFMVAFSTGLTIVTSGPTVPADLTVNFG